MKKKSNWEILEGIALLIKPVTFSSLSKIASVGGFMNKKTGEIRLFSEETVKLEGPRKIIEQLENEKDI